jgi:hypothetical protein
MSPAEEAELVARNEEHGLAYQDPDSETQIQVIEPGGLAAITKSEIESQLDAAHKYPRKISQCMAEAMAMVSRSVEVASSCFYVLPPRRGGDGKSITGPSVRLAEIAASAWGNLHYGARPVDVGQTDVTSQGVAWDLQKNVRVTVEKKRRITTKSGGRFGDDMIIATQNAASSIALRDAVFRVIPRAYIHELDQHARKVAIGDAKTLADRRSKAFLHFAQMGATRDRVLAALGRVDIEAVTLDDMEKLIGYATAIKDGQSSVDECFPVVKPVESAPQPTQAEEGRKMKLGKEKTESKPRVTIEGADQPPMPDEPGSNG